MIKYETIPVLNNIKLKLKICELKTKCQENKYFMGS